MRVRGKEVGAGKRLVSNEFYHLLVLYLVSTTTTLRGQVLVVNVGASQEQGRVKSKGDGPCTRLGDSDEGDSDAFLVSL